MPKITSIINQKNPLRVSIFVEGKFWRGCTKRVAENLGLVIGKEIDKEETDRKINFFWKDLYQPKRKDSSKRQEAIKSLIESWGYVVKIIGFGANTEEYIKHHPKEKGGPDLEIEINDKKILLESTGCPSLRGEGLWIRPDKVEYAKNHPEKNVWVAHRIDVSNEIRFIKLIEGKIYEAEEVDTGYSKELMVIFNTFDKEIKTKEEFKKYLKK